ncbi:polysaccharide deacetylase family protein [Methylobacterium planeticum]|uniref:Uncharacterized protein n=1 Tax=Methylobacterium planeticum TaxID=2615211 RepID=A0A6N6MGR6_9HYPH|nr:hypothetical protein [Methylobacterium planeticum]KAB1070137.1 hypothetical protein F6X51_23490 [Methylobacterium planeticum]
MSSGFTPHRTGLTACGMGIWMCWLGLLIVLPGSAAVASSAVGRTVLALYDGDVEHVAAETRIHRYAELPLNHLGFVVEYRDVRQALPSAGDVSRYAGVLSWFSAPPADRRAYLDWARIALRSARRVVVLGASGGSYWTDDAVAVDAVLGSIGLRHGRRAVELTLGTILRAPNRALVAFEGQRDPVLPAFEVVEKLRPDFEPWLELAVPEREGGGHSVVVGVSSRGGYAASGYEIVEDPAFGRARWLIDPFTFFARALRDEPSPIPDVTTLSGRRIFFSHVESEGLNNVVLTKAKEQVLVAQIFQEEIVNRYTDLPVTFALTPGDLDPTIGGNETPREFVQAIWSSPQVEPSVASYTRPYRWEYFETYDRAREEDLIAHARTPGRFGLRRLADYVNGSTRTDRFVAKAREYPRNYLLKPFDLVQETEGAAAIVRDLSPSDKQPRLYQWTGDARPSEEMIAATRGLGLLNINGGEARFDQLYPSAAHLPPIARPVGNQRQIYAVGADEVPLVRMWRPAVEALRGLRTTLGNTEAPRRLKGFNLHYHLMTIGNSEALHLIQAYLDEARNAPVIPIRTSDYAAMADDFFRVEIVATGPSSWSIRNRGAVQTLRFDEADTVEIDLARSEGVLGSTRQGSVLYVSLDPAVATVRLALGAAGSKPCNLVGLRDSRWQVSGLSRDTFAWRFSAQGYGPGDFTWEGVAPGRYRVEAHRADKLVWSVDVEPDARGQLAFSVAPAAIEPLSLSIARQQDAAGGVR